MAYDAAVALVINVVPRIGLGGQAIWTYSSADIHTDVDENDYFTNGSADGLQVGDVVIVTKNTATIGATIHVVTVVTAGGAATVSAAILA